MFDLFAAADSFLRQPSGWLAIALILLVVWLVRYVTDIRSELTLVKQASAHNLTAPFLTQYTTNMNRRQLMRIRNAAKRASKSSAGSSDPSLVLQRFEQEIQAEINTLEATFGATEHEESESEDPDSALSSSQEDGDDRDPDDEEQEMGDDQNPASPPPAQGDDSTKPQPGDDDYDFETVKDHNAKTARVRARTVHETEYTIAS